MLILIRALVVVGMKSSPPSARRRGLHGRQRGHGGFGEVAAAAEVKRYSPSWANPHSFL
jgi:hypothetical protein